MVTWDSSKGKYIVDGSVLSPKEVGRLAKESTKYAAAQIEHTLQSYKKGEISLETATSELKKAVKFENVRQFLGGVGGKMNATKKDYGKIGSLTKSQYGIVNNLLSNAANYSDAQIASYSKMLANGANSSYGIARAGIAAKLGYTTVLWAPGHSANRCGTCVDRVAAGPMPIGKNGGFPWGGTEVFPGDGSSECGSFDRCGLEYSNEAGETY